MLPNLTVLENLRLGTMASDPAGAEQRLEEALQYFPPASRAHRPEGPVPVGRRAADAGHRAGLVARPRIMLVDEAIEGLASLLVRSLTRILREINRRGTTILLVEQTLDVAMALSHRLYVMDQGRIQFEGTPDVLRKDPTIQQRFLQV
ncbi:MAG TPA: hypothetical protein VFT36_01625 [Methylomirabilota bacterium]|nr:hypothetical protein [Methylomirabilota bacterium]